MKEKDVEVKDELELEEFRKRLTDENEALNKLLRNIQSLNLQGLVKEKSLKKPRKNGKK